MSERNLDRSDTPTPKTGQQAAAAAAARRRAAEAAARARAIAAARAAAYRAASRARALARQRAAYEAQRRAAQERIAAQRRKAYDELRRRRSDALRQRGLVRDRAMDRIPDGPRRPTPRQQAAARADVALEKQQLRRARTEGEKRKLANDEALRQSAQLRQRADAMYRHRLAQLAANRRRGIQPTEQDYERLVREEERLAREGRGSSERVREYLDEYTKLAEKVSADYKKAVDAINDAIDKGNVERARTLYRGEFQKIAARYRRLFGDGKDPQKDGAFNSFFRSYSAIAEHQREWWKRQVQAALDQDRSDVNKRLKAARATGDESTVRELEELARVYDGETGMVVDGVDAQGHLKYRKRTIEEELDYREAQRRIEMERIRSQMNHARQARQRLTDFERVQEGPGGWLYGREDLIVMRDVASVVRDRFGGVMPKVKRTEDLRGLADALVDAWEKRNPAPASGGWGRDTREQGAWRKRRAEYEAQVYQFFGSKSPEGWERLIALPGVSHALTGLQVPVAGIGAGARVLSRGLGNPHSQTYLGPTLGDAPEKVRDYARSLGYLAGREWFAKWRESEEGKAWQRQHRADWEKRVDEEDKEFLEGFYHGDIGDRARALIEYGSRPSSDEGANLLFQLLADPTNAIPLKFTTYLARAKYASELSGKSKLLGSAKLGSVRDFLRVDEGTLKLRKFLDGVVREQGVNKSARQLTDEILADLAGVTEKSAQVKAIDKRLRAAGVKSRKVDATQLFHLIEHATTERVRHAGVDYFTQTDELAERIKVAEAERKAKAEGRRAVQVSRETQVQAGRKSRLDASKAARERVAAAQRAEERRVAPEPKVAPVSAAPRPMSVVEKKVVRLAEAKPRRVGVELRRARRTAEYYRPDELGNLLPKESRVAADPRYRELVVAAKGGDKVAQERVALIARQRRNIARMEAEDVRRASRFTQTDFDLLERAGVAHDAEAAARLLTDRETVRFLKRTVGRNRSGSDELAREFVVGKGGIERELDIELSPADDRIAIGGDLIHARDESPRGLRDAYEVFSGQPERTRAFSGPLYDRVRSASWRKTLGPARFGKVLQQLDDEVLGSGAAGFRDGGQALFELFHRLRLGGDLAKLERLSSYVDALLHGLDDPYDSLFAWQWKAMEERAGLPWAWNWQTVEDGFMEAAARWNMHPNLALAMIPNGFFAHRAPYRFRLSSALLGVEDSAVFKAAPGDWTESDALKAVTATFSGSMAPNATRVVHYVAERFGEFQKAFKISNRIVDELTDAVRREMGDEALLAVLSKRSHLLGDDVVVPAQRTGKTLDEAIGLELTRRQKAQPLRPEYPGLRPLIQDAYFSGELTLKNPEAHKLMLLARLQDRPRSWVGAAEAFVGYVGADEAKSFLRELFRDRIDNLAVRFASERLGRAERGVDPITGEAFDRAATREWKLWDRLGFTPDVDRVRAWLEAKGEARHGVSTGAAREAKLLRQYEDADSLVRDFMAQHEFDREGLAQVGSFDPDVVKLRVDRRIAKRDFEGAADELARLADRAIRLGVSGEEFEAIREVAQSIGELPEGQLLLDKLRDRIGDDNLSRWLNFTGGVKGYQRPKPTRAPAATGEAAKADVEPLPERTVVMSNAEAALTAVSGMTEEQWWRVATQRAKATLRSRTATPQAKLDAKRMLADVDAAKYAKSQERRAGGFVPPGERARFENRVLAEHGVEAEGLVAPKLIAPYVEDLQGLLVEQTRTLWRFLKSAAPDAVESRVRGISRKGAALDHLPFEVWEAVEREVSDAIATARGFRADVRTRSRRAGRLDDDRRKVGKLSDDDPVVVEAKRRALSAFEKRTGYAIPMEAYDEARRVLWKGHVQNKSATWLMHRAQEIVARFGGEYREVYLRLRAKEARAEGRRQLSILARGEMFGHSPTEIMAEFEARYSDDGVLRGFTPELSAFQRRTVEEHVKALSGVDDLTDEVRMSAWLQSRNLPPVHSRDASREFLTDIGAWAPRKAEQFVEGRQSWSVEAEAAYWKTNYGVVPEWADVQKLTTDFDHIFDEQDLYYEQHRAWGILNRSAEVQIRLSGESAEAIEEAVIKGDAALGLRSKRSLDLLRRYVIERFGKIVSDDGVTLKRMPWLMYPDEYRAYLGRRMSEGLAEGLIQTADELDEVLRMIDEAIDETGFWDKYIAPKAADGPIKYEDVFRLSSAIQARLLADPRWARRYRDVFVGGALNAWATIQRAMVFTQFSFMAANIVDVPIKTGWYRFTRRQLFNPGLVGAPEDVVRRAQALTPASLGIDAQTTLYQLRQRPAREYVLHPVHKGVAGAVERGTGVFQAVYRFFPEKAGKVELLAKMQMARGMYPQVYAEALARLGNDDLADAAARRFIKDEIGRMWPTVGDHPLEHLFNQLVPFASYSVRNQVLFISEALAHPAILNQIEFIGAAVERENRKRWDEDHPGEPLPDWAARRIELPWAPGYFLDLGQFSDATRGLKPIYRAGTPKSYLDFVSQFVRIVNPGTQAGIYMLTNALGVTQRVQWKPILNERGFVTGYEKVLTGWTEPWSDEQPTWASVWWFLEAAEEAKKLGAGGWTAGEVSQLIGKVAMFDAVRGVDPGPGLYEFYKALREKNRDDAARWLAESEKGKFLQEWLLAHTGSLQDAADWFSLAKRRDADPKRWFHDQSPEFQRRVGDAYGEMTRIRQRFESQLFDMTPGTAEYRDTKARMLLAISEVYRVVPELLTYEVYSKSASEWSTQLERWQTNKLLDDFFALDRAKPSRASYKTAATYGSAVEAWRHQKEVFLKTYPQVEAVLGNSRDELSRVRDVVEKEWDEVLQRIAKRSEAIEAAKKAEQHDRADLLYLQNELDYSLLERDYVALQFTEEDFAALPKDVLGPPSLVKGALAKATVLLDFDRLRYEKAVREGRGQKFLDDAFFAQSMREVILKAKGGDAFGKFDPAVFVRELRKRPRLLSLYFDKNPGKQQRWAQNDRYIALIAPWGRAARRGDWDEAERIWARLPQWVKDRYRSKHPRRASSVASAAYVGYMKRWVAHFERGDSKGGMKFFWAMPEWVRERYFSKHPDKRAKFEGQLKHGAELAAYFGMDQAGRADYLAKHPGLKRWLARNVSKEEQRRQAILAGYQAIPKDEQWLRRVYREKYPEVFSQEAKGEQRLKRVYDRLAAHPEMLPEFEKWVKAIWDSYAEMLRLSGARPREIRADHSLQHRSARRSLSAAEVSTG